MKRVCLLTGGGGTFGQAFCRSCAGKYEIAAFYRRRMPLVPSQSTSVIDPLDPRAACSANNDRIFAIECDLLDPVAVERAVSLVLARFGRVDLLINAAAMTVRAPILNSASLLETASRQFELNAVAPLRLASLVARRSWRDNRMESLEANRNIINISSLSASQVFPGKGQSIYSASKAALNTLTLHMASEFRGIGIRVNALAPTSFPSLVPTSLVIEAVRAIDESRQTGQVIELDAAGTKTRGEGAADSVMNPYCVPKDEIRF